MDCSRIGRQSTMDFPSRMASCPRYPLWMICSSSRRAQKKPKPCFTSWKKTLLEAVLVVNKEKTQFIGNWGSEKLPGQDCTKSGLSVVGRIVGFDDVTPFDLSQRVSMASTQFYKLHRILALGKADGLTGWWSKDPLGGGGCKKITKNGPKRLEVATSGKLASTI